MNEHQSIATADRRLVGVDVGGTKILGVVVDPTSGSILESTRVATPVGAEEVTSAIGDVAEHLMTTDAAGDSIGGVGVGVPGLVDLDGVLRYGPNAPGILDYAFAPALVERLGVSVVVENDGFNAAVAEHRFGAARKAENAVIATQGTGIGGALLVNGRLVRGANGFAGEPGHMLVNKDYYLCACGQTGCWESLASGTGLANIARQVIEEGDGQEILALAGGDLAGVRGEHVSEAFRHGDAGARIVMDRFSYWVARGLGSLISILDPEIVVLGGGLSEIGDEFLTTVQDRVMDSVVGGAHRPQVPVVSAQFGPEAGALGAALNVEESGK